jgi:hypothetical protein
LTDNRVGLFGNTKPKTHTRRVLDKGVYMRVVEFRPEVHGDIEYWELSYFRGNTEIFLC